MEVGGSEVRGYGNGLEEALLGTAGVSENSQCDPQPPEGAHMVGLQGEGPSEGGFCLLQASHGTEGRPQKAWDLGIFRVEALPSDEQVHGFVILLDLTVSDGRQPEGLRVGREFEPPAEVNLSDRVLPHLEEALTHVLEKERWVRWVRFDLP